MLTEKVSVEDSIKQSMVELDESEDMGTDEEVQVEAPEKSERTRDETGKFSKKDKEEPEEPEIAEVKPEIASPQSLPAALKDKWGMTPAEVREWLSKREEDHHRMLTSPSGELQLGKQMKEVITPYMPIITAEGGNPAAAVQSLLNTAYQLRTGTPQQKAQMIKTICDTYGVDLTHVNTSQPQVDPAIQQVMDRLNGIEQKFTHQNTLQEQEISAKITSEIQAFSADPKNVHFEQVRTHMGALMGSGQAKDLQEAYDAACWANPQIRSTLLANQEKEAAEKRKAEVAKKKQAAVSVTGSPGVKVPNSGTPKKTIEEELSDAYDDIAGSKL